MKRYKETLASLLIFLVIIGCSQQKKKAYFDVPSLVGKNIDETRKILAFEEQVDPVDDSITHWSDNYEIDEHTLLINYNPKTRKIYDISIIYPDGYSQKEELLQTGNLNFKGKGYFCEIDSNIWSLSPFTSYNGVKIRFNE